MCIFLSCYPILRAEIPSSYLVKSRRCFSQDYTGDSRNEKTSVIYKPQNLFAIYAN